MKFDFLENGKVVVSHPSEDEVAVPLFCPICSFPMKTLDDIVCFPVNKTCNHCEMRWSGSKLGSWKEGWRPGPETPEWDDYIQERKLLSRLLINLR